MFILAMNPVRIRKINIPKHYVKSKDVVLNIKIIFSCV